MRRLQSTCEDAMLSMSYCEIYNEQIRDLLTDVKKDIKIQSAKTGNAVILAGLTSLPVQAFENFRTIFLAANEKRKTAATGCNSVSSRSHAVLERILEKHTR